MFESIIGHEKQKELFENLLKNDELSHAYLFIGPNGIGKASFARELAKYILKTDNLDTCLDYKYVSKDESKKDLSVEKIREEVIDSIYIAPAMSSKKVYIIDDGECLNIAAQNALLKTLEEPPKNIHIIIISNTSSTFLPTIISRINQIRFSGISKEKLKEYVKKMYNTELSNNILEFLNGSIGGAKKTIDENKLEKFSQVEKIFNLIKGHDVVDALLTASNGVFQDLDMLKYLEFIMERDKKLLPAKFVEKANTRLKNNGNYDIVIDNMIINLVDII